MYARLNTIFGTTGGVDAGLAYIEDSDRGAVEATAGNRGLATLVDWQHGVIIALSYWDEPWNSSGAALTGARVGSAVAARGDLVTENYEVVVDRRVAMPLVGAAVWMARMQLDTAPLADVVAFYREAALPELERCAGLCSAELLLDRDFGNGVSVTVWEDAAAAAPAESVLESLREEAGRRFAAKSTRNESYIMVRTSVRID